MSPAAKKPSGPSLFAAAGLDSDAPRPLADKLRLFPDLARSFRIYENPLAIRYFSQTPYALEGHEAPLEVVKYMAVPVDPAEQAPIVLTPEQMAALEAAKGTAFDRLFLSVRSGSP